MIRFRKEVYATRLLDPRRAFSSVEIPSEVRYDPLTGETGRVAHFLTDWLPPSNLEAWGPLINGGFCPFCPENVEKVTPRFPEDLVPGGRLRRGEAVVFPNLSPYDEISAVTVVTASHFPALGDFTSEQLLDAFRISLDFLSRVQQDRPQFHGFVSWNYLPPAGSSQLHPHLQVFGSAVPPNSVRTEREAEAAYRRAQGRSYWTDLVEAEKARGERYLGRIGETEWLVAFRPQGALGEVIALLGPEARLLSLGDAVLHDLAAGLLRLFLFMQENNLVSFNALLYEGEEGARLRFAPRFYIHPSLYTSDVNFLKMMCGEPITVVAPEDLALRVRPYFARQPVERRPG
ncbi:MAG: hypothetical protein QHH27_05950 [Clostridia bacterium]|jgi:galactose-1-phosphate uridylyltransferase|nr:hypothetical protein [Clostridia bacterium]MDH7573078.1 hypothetical protein [Clostridia bacterium]